MLKGTDDEDNIGASADGYGSDGNGDSEISITSGIRTIRRPSLLDANSKNDDNDDIAVKLVRSTSQHDSPSSSSSSSSVSSSASSSALCSITTTVGSQNRNQHETQQQQQQPQDNDNDTCSSTTIFYSSIIIDDISTLPPLSEPRHGIMKEESSRGICLVLTVIVLLPIVVHYIALTVILPSSDPDDSDNNYLIMLPGKMTFLVLVYLEITLGVIGLCGILYVDPCVIHRSKETCFPIPIQVESYIIEYQQYTATATRNDWRCYKLSTIIAAHTPNNTNSGSTTIIATTTSTTSTTSTKRKLYSGK
ncbi:hypothetical protein FRACYDRAFT_257243 [Fragilariopsis cylindrus CCMP1102]|uniref:Uncharacterized protein n=1 Tax=Fragilariopsis cylindrus CCMP1102 TaxID=635003 RepID=A0A1E7EJA0_9STRA|nr:hypothetical protein FRACYDRAFT_257243 [Fragilariopsis cylindrus CCMP1102]|eukprot:OEU05950.1 hypothetical protein FRACYDRAFT_257243 [Fragilariopsis cylindrus CCMP1102]